MYIAGKTLDAYIERLKKQNRLLRIYILILLIAFVGLAIKVI